MQLVGATAYHSLCELYTIRCISMKQFPIIAVFGVIGINIFLLQILQDNGNAALQGSGNTVCTSIATPTIASPSPLATPPLATPTIASPSPLATPPLATPTIASPSPLATPSLATPTIASPSPLATPSLATPTIASPSPLATPALCR